MQGEGRGFFGWIFLLLFIGVVLGALAFGAYVLYQQYGSSIFNQSPPPITLPENYTSQPAPPDNTVTIASWNLQRLGPTKAENEQLMDYYAQKLGAYDIAVVQEITDSSGYAWNKLCYKMQGYDCKLSERRGNTTYKEQYGLLYKRDKVRFDRWVDDVHVTGYQREPLDMFFTVGNWSFKLITLHTTPGAVHKELSALEIQTIPSYDQYAGDKIIIGDLNADCEYYPSIVDFTLWNWKVPSGEDTTVGQTECAYDRIIINPSASEHFVRYGVMRDVAPEQSDHYLIWGEFSSD